MLILVLAGVLQGEGGIIGRLGMVAVADAEADGVEEEDLQQAAIA